jgi:hypothetical protein
MDYSGSTMRAGLGLALIWVLMLAHMHSTHPIALRPVEVDLSSIKWLTSLHGMPTMPALTRLDLSYPDRIR